ncbi:MAG TPA: hypothetical protein VN783_11210 [Thermoanaerobaculia bacterium]|nr:hypothetical protein [Thermoanaerobaculia bacterium]
MSPPLYPQLRVSLRSRHPLALLSATRQALRQAGLDRNEIARFSDEAAAGEGPTGIRAVCARWVSLEG